jgi:GST-like protein
MKLYGSPGCGSAAVEVALQLAGQPYEYVQTSFWDQNEHFAELKRVNPQAKVPTLVLDDGTVMTESAAMLLFAGDLAPGLVPAGASARAQFCAGWFIPPILRHVSISATCRRGVESETTQQALKQKSVEQQKFFWGLMEADLHPQPYLLGAQMTVLDIYVAMVSRWRPGRAWFNQHCPKLAAAVALTESHPVVAAVWEKNFGK